MLGFASRSGSSTESNVRDGIPAVQRLPTPLNFPEYDGGGRIVGQTDALGNTTQYVYDKLGRQVEEIQPDAAGSTVAATGVCYGAEPTGAIAYMASPAPIAVANASFETPVVTGQSGYVVDPSGASWTFSGASGIANNSAAFTDDNSDAPDGCQVAYLENAGSLSQSISFPAAGTYTIGFQAAYCPDFAGADPFAVKVDGQTAGTFTPTTYATYQGCLVSFAVSTGGSHTVSFVGLDSSGQEPISLIDGVWISAGSPVPSTTVTLTTYDDAHDKRYVTNPLGSGYTDVCHTTETDYDKVGQVLKVIQPAPVSGQSQPTTTYTYDADGNLATVTDPRGFETVYSYDESDRKTVEEDVDPDGAGNVYTWYYYDADGNLQYVVDAGGATSADPPATFSSSPNYTTQYVYDNLDRKTEEIDPSPSTARLAPPPNMGMTPTGTWFPRPTPTAT